eukprot:2799838-Karenia_brevis.AAC.1
MKLTTYGACGVHAEEVMAEARKPLCVQTSRGNERSQYFAVVHHMRKSQSQENLHSMMTQGTCQNVLQKKESKRREDKEGKARIQKIEEHQSSIPATPHMRCMNDANH